MKMEFNETTYAKTKPKYFTDAFIFTPTINRNIEPVKHVQVQAACVAIRLHTPLHVRTAIITQ